MECRYGCLSNPGPLLAESRSGRNKLTVPKDQEFTTDSDGIVGLDPAILPEALIRVSYLGFQTEVFDRPSQELLAIVVLVRTPVELEGIEVLASSSPSCDSGADDGREIWERFRTSWSRAPASKIGVRRESAEVVGPLDQPGLDEWLNRKKPSWSAWKIPYRYRVGPLQVDSVIGEEGYAWERHQEPLPQPCSNSVGRMHPISHLRASGSHIGSM